MKKFVVNYSVTTSYDVVIRAKNQKEAEQKVREVIGDPVEIDSSYEYKEA